MLGKSLLETMGWKEDRITFMMTKKELRTYDMLLELEVCLDSIEKIIKCEECSFTDKTYIQHNLNEIKELVNARKHSLEQRVRRIVSVSSSEEQEVRNG